MQNLFKRLSFFAAIVCLISSPLFSRGELLPSGSKAPSLSFKGLTGQTQSIDSFYSKNDYTIINFWATWCTACIEEFPELEKAQSSKVQVLAINVGESLEQVEKSLKGLKISFPVLLDVKQSAKESYDLSVLPTTYILDSNGRLRAKILGSVTVAKLKNTIEKIKKAAH